MDQILVTLTTWFGRLGPIQRTLLGLATTMFVIELVLRRWPDSPAYQGWQKIIHRIGEFWTAIILSVVYFLSVGMVGVAFRLVGNDPLDRRFAPGSTWKPHDPNPLGARAAARHQF